MDIGDFIPINNNGWLPSSTSPQYMSSFELNKAVLRSPSPINFNMGTMVGSYVNVAKMLDEVATMPGVKGIMLTFDDFLEGLDTFGERIQSLMKCRKDRLPLATE
jgi:hypothetical protein